MQPEPNRQVLHLASRRDDVENTKKPFDPINGHEAILKTLIRNRSNVIIVLDKDGSSVVGRISQFDTTTITIYPEDNAGLPETFFKHAIRSFTVEPKNED